MIRNDEKIRRLVIQALSQDDELFEKLVLKGGNVLSLVYGLNNRASTDLDYSLHGNIDSETMMRYQSKMRQSLETLFRENKLEIFDFKFTEKPRTPLDPVLAKFWGGYCLEFKAIDKEKFDRIGGDNLDALRRESIRMNAEDGKSSPRMEVDFSKFEYTEKFIVKEVDGYAVRVYSPELIVCEKIRAICQQMPEYQAIIHSKKSSPRPRDFFDIYHVAEAWKVNFEDPGTQDILRNVFDCKRVPFDLLKKIGDQETHDFHAQAYGELSAVVEKGKKLESFLFYFDFVKDLVKPLLGSASE
jgi:predicted nucleotidyltransferase component of viral defense system